MSLFLDTYEDLLARGIGSPGLILATAMADCSKLLVFDPQVRSRFFKLALKARRFPNPMLVAAIRRAKRAHGAALQQAFQAS